MASNVRIADGSYDFSQGVDSGSVPTIRSANNPNGLARQELAWLTNGTVRGGGITQRTGWQALVAPLLATGLYQGGYMYEPPYADPYLVISVSGILYSVTLTPPYTLTNLTATAGPPFPVPDDYLEFFAGSYPAFEPRNTASVVNPATAAQVWMCQAEQFLVIQAGDLFNPPVPTGLDNWRVYIRSR